MLLAISKTPLTKRKLLLDSIDISKATLERILTLLSSKPLGSTCTIPMLLKTDL